MSLRSSSVSAIRPNAMEGSYEAQVTELLAPTDPDTTQAFFAELCSLLGCSSRLEVRPAGPQRGKGIFALQNMQRGDEVLQERPLVAIQHAASQAQCLVCSQCFRFLGSIEEQVARKLQHTLDQLEQLQRRAMEQGAAGEGAGAEAGGSGGGDDGSEGEDKVDPEELAELVQKAELITSAGVDKDLLSALATGQRHLPLSSRFPLPQPVACRSGCGAVYCGSSCEEAAWRLHHRLLCCAEPPPAPAPALGSDPPSTDPPGSDKPALAAFFAHAAASNEIFCLVAKVLAVTVLRAEGRGQLPGSYPEPWPAALKAADAVAGRQQAPAAAPGPSSSPVGGVSDAPGPSGSCAAAGGRVGCGREDWAALRLGWLPFANGWKHVWWESVAVPGDVEDEAGFRQQLRDLARHSLGLLSAALPSYAARFPPLFSEEVFGAVVGMFELNNLSLSVPSPVEDYFLLIDDLKEDEGAAAKAQTQPLLDALDKSYDEPCEGTGFYALQSCANHSCCPVATAEGEGSGATSLLALSTIVPGQEVLISYIDEELGYRERQLALRDYGFACECEKCGQEKAQRTASRKAGKKRPARKK